MIGFGESQEATFRRVVRDQIRRGPFSKGQRDALLAFMNHWFVHRSSKCGVVHPGRKRIAKKAGVTVKTVSRLFEILRFYGAIEVVDNLNGLRGNATEYTVNTEVLSAVCRLKKADWRKTVGHLSLPSGGTKCPTVLGDAQVFRFPLSSGGRHE